ncbi:MAG TPA: type III-B CRISPR module RAMP protein Cmr4 [Kofleriaceae bacterium]|nr:type III-B CRISPR module RAMP protein Cmr4 [Kofleriaceae bacterium]
MLAESAIHTGTGRSAGVIDLPIAREAATDYPFIPGSSTKGALRDRARRGWPDHNWDPIFGLREQAGQLLVADARLLLLPVRCLTGTYRWVTCPQILERYRRDLQRSGLACDLPRVAPTAGEADRAATVYARGRDRLYLEERELSIAGECPAAILDAIRPRIRHQETAARLADQLAIVSNDDMAWFCRYAIPVQARNVLDCNTKTSKNLWYEESLPADTVLYTLLLARDTATRDAVARLFPDDDPYLQLGGNETVGHGWFAVQLAQGGRP